MRKPVRSTVANRKYFQGGGLAPMKPAAPEEAVGIMASSQPLVDMVAQSAGNPQGGMSPLNFNQGGTVDVPTGRTTSRLRDLDLKLGRGLQNLYQNLYPRSNIKADFYDLIPGGEGIPSAIRSIFTKDALTKSFSVGQLGAVDMLIKKNPKKDPRKIMETAYKVYNENPNYGKEIDSKLQKAVDQIGRAVPRELTSEEIERNKTSIDPITDKQREQSKKSIKEAEAQRIEEITKSIEGKDASDKDIKTEEFTFPFAKQEKTSVAKTSEDQQDNQNAETIANEKGVNAILDKTTQEPVNQNEEAKTAMDETIQNINKNAEEGNQEETEKSIEDYTEEFKKAMPKFEGMTEEEKGFAIMEAGLAIMGGQSPRALENISNGLQPLVKKFAKNKEQERAFNQQINIAAAKYGISKVDQDRARDLALSDQLAKEGRTYAPGRVVLKPFTYKGKKYGKNDFFEFTRGEMETNEFKNIPAGTLASESAFGQIKQSERTFSDNLRLIEVANAAFKKEQLGQGIKSAEFDKNMETYQKSGEGYYTGLRMRAQLGEAAAILMDDPDAILGAKGYLGTMADKALNLAGLNRGELNALRNEGKLKIFNAKMKQIGTTMLVEILNESTKTISDQDRKRVEELTSQVLRGGDFTKSLKEVQDMMTFLDGQIKKGIVSNTTTMNRLERKFEDGLKIKDVDIKTLDPKEQLKGIRDDLTFGFTGRGGQAIKISDIWDPDGDDGAGDFKTELSFPKGTQT